MDYYRLHKDTVMGASVAGEYRNFARLLRFLICDRAVENDVRELAEEKLTELESVFGEVVQMAESNEDAAPF